MANTNFQVKNGLTVGNLTITASSANLVTSGTISVNSGNGATAIVNGGTTGTGNIGAVGAVFNTVYATATTALYADLAEVYSSDKNYPAGTVVIIGGQFEVTESTQDHDVRIAGVISKKPAYLMNSEAQGVAVALTGRVYCNVVGNIAKGDRLVSSTIAGFAQKLDENKYQPGWIIGKALEDFTGTTGRIEVLVGRT